MTRLTYTALMLGGTAATAAIAHSGYDPGPAIVGFVMLAVLKLAISCVRAEDAGRTWKWGFIVIVPLGWVWLAFQRRAA